MHDLLRRQIRKLGIDPDAPAMDAASLAALCERISKSYATADQDRYLLERSLNLASAEMRQLYDQQQVIAERRYQHLLESANDIVFTVDMYGQFTSINGACTELTGYATDELLCHSWSEFFDATDHAVAHGMRLHEQGDPTAAARFETEIISRSGETISLEVSCHVVTHEGVAWELFGVARDTSERKANESHLVYLARHDLLTGLPNRSVLEEALTDAIAETAQTRQLFVLGMIDLDDFKLINDTLGHAAGDQVLATVADVLRACLPEATIVRISGDEFGFILRADVAAEALRLAERIRENIAAADVEVHGERVFVTASIGLVRVDAAADPSGLLAEADAAMYTAKEAGRNRLHWSGSRDALTARLAEVPRRAASVRNALEAGRMELHYQPVVALDEHGGGHYEALIRMRAEDGELLSPGMFLGAADRAGLMPAIDRFVLDTVLEQLRRSPRICIFANLSAATLADRTVLTSLMKTLSREPGLGARLGLEITETAVLRDTALARDWIQQLGGLGCEFALDDFGTGFNSLTLLLQLPVHQIKIDGSFVSAITTDPKQRAVVAAITVLAEGLGMKTVAECIEDLDTLRAIRSLGVTYGQGYYLGRPAPDLLAELRAAA